MKNAIAVVVIGALAVGGCAKKDMPSSRTQGAEELAKSPAADAKPSTNAALAPRPADTRKVIRTGRVELVVATYDDARAKLDALVKAAGGYIDSTQVERGQTAVSSAVLVIRLPAGAFEGVIPELRELGDVTGETTNAADITDQYIDTTARLASAEVLEKRLLELATARDGKVDQLLAVERELARVRGEIEGYKGHLNQWNDQIALSTLTISITTRRAEIASAAPASLGSRSSHAFESSIRALGDLGGWLVVNGIGFLPWLTILIPAGLLARRLARRYRRSLPVAVVTERS